MISNDPAPFIWHEVYPEPEKEQPLVEGPNYIIDAKNQIGSTAQMYHFSGSTTNRLKEIDFKKYTILVIGRTVFDEVTHYGVDTEQMAESKVSVVHYKLPLKLSVNANLIREFIFVKLTKAQAKNLNLTQVGVDLHVKLDIANTNLSLIPGKVAEYERKVRGDRQNP